MKKVFCDRCDRECTDSYMKLKIPLHITEGDLSGYAIMQHGELIPVSGRDVEYELCHTCYNKAYEAAYGVIKEGN